MGQAFDWIVICTVLQKYSPGTAQYTEENLGQYPRPLEVEKICLILELFSKRSPHFRLHWNCKVSLPPGPTASKAKRASKTEANRNKFWLNHNTVTITLMPITAVGSKPFLSRSFHLFSIIFHFIPVMFQKSFKRPGFPKRYFKWMSNQTINGVAL